MKDISVTRFVIYFFVMTIMISLIVINLFTMVDRMYIESIDDTIIPTVGIISAGEFLVNVFEEDKVTPLIDINWGTIEVFRTYHYSIWIYSSNAFDGETVKITWTHDAPSFLTHEAIIERNNAWYTWNTYINRTFPSDGFLHVDFRLTADDSQPTITSFSYFITLITS